MTKCGPTESICHQPQPFIGSTVTVPLPPFHRWDYVTKFGEQCDMDSKKYGQECAEHVFEQASLPACLFVCWLGSVGWLFRMASGGLHLDCTSQAATGGAGTCAFWVLLAQHRARLPPSSRATDQPGQQPRVLAVQLLTGTSRLGCRRSTRTSGLRWTSCGSASAASRTTAITPSWRRSWRPKRATPPAGRAR